jgi:hypothetical protein
MKFNPIGNSEHDAALASTKALITAMTLCLGVLLWVSGLLTALNVTTAQACPSKPDPASGISVSVSVGALGDEKGSSPNFSPVITILCQRTWRTESSGYATEYFSSTGEKSVFVTALTATGFVSTSLACIAILASWLTAVANRRLHKCSSTGQNRKYIYQYFRAPLILLPMLVASLFIYTSGLQGSASASCFSNDSSAAIGEWSSYKPLPPTPQRSNVLNALQTLDANTYEGYGQSYGDWFLRRHVSALGNVQCEYGPGPGSPVQTVTWQGATSNANTVLTVLGLSGIVFSLLLMLAPITTTGFVHMELQKADTKRFASRLFDADK